MGEEEEEEEEEEDKAGRIADVRISCRKEDERINRGGSKQRKSRD